MEMQRLQKKASIMKGSCLNGVNAIKSNFKLLSWKYVPGITESEFERTFSRIFGEDVDTFTRTFSQNIDTLETQLTKETLHEAKCQTAFRVLKMPFEKIFTSVLIKSSNLNGKRIKAAHLNESSRLGNECSERSNSGDDTEIRPSYDTEPMA
ncbi:hypothetical protein Tco_0603292 [Tanacetum coccineum]